MTTETTTTTETVPSGAGGETPPLPETEASEMQAAFETEQPTPPPPGGEPPKTDTPPPPEYVQITREEYDAFKGLLAKTTSIEGTLSKIAGTTGNLQQAIERLRSETPAGTLVEVSEEDFPELVEEFPDLARLTVKGLNTALKRGGTRGTGTAATATPPAETTPPQQTEEERLEAALRERRRAEELATLDELHPDWKEIVGYDQDATARANNEFRKWLALQPQEYRDKINTTSSAAITSRAIDQFLADKTRKAPTPGKQPASNASVRQDRLAAAVTPRGAGGGPPPPPKAQTEAEAMRAAFAS